MYKNNRPFVPDIDTNIKSTKKMKRRPDRNIIINPKLKRGLCFLAGCIHIVIFVLIYVFGIKHLSLRHYIDGVAALMVFGAGFLAAGIFCFRHFVLFDKDKANIITVSIGVLLVAFSVSVLVLMFVDAWVNHTAVDRDIFVLVFGCIIGFCSGILIIKGGLKGGRPREVLKSLDNNPVNNDKKRNLKNFAENHGGFNMNTSGISDDEMDDDEDVYEEDEAKKRSKMGKTIYKTLLNNKPNENIFR